MHMGIGQTGQFNETFIVDALNQYPFYEGNFRTFDIGKRIDSQLEEIYEIRLVFQ